MKTILIIAILCIMAGTASGANIYVRDGGTASNCRGTDWDTANACDSIGTAESLAQRGDTIYVADGSYSGATLSVPVSGTTYIYIKKASATDHGTDTGWVSTYGDGQATFSSGLVTSTGYWDINGAYRSTWSTGYGFKITHSGSGKGVGASVSVAVDNIRVKYVEIQGSGLDGSGLRNDGIYFDSTSSGTFDNMYFGYLYIHDQGRCPFLLRSMKDSIIEYNYVARNENNDAEHAEGISLYEDGPSNIIIRHNIWEDIEGTGVIVIGGEGTHATNIQVYGNLIYWTSNYPFSSWGAYVTNGAITSWTTETMSNSFFYNNTIILPASGGISFKISPNGAGSGNVAYNNLFYSSGTIGNRVSYSGTTHDYNAYSGGNSEGEAHEQTNITSSYFASPSTYNFRLNQATNTGASLSSPYNIDLLGNARGSDGTWDRGAYEYVTGGSPPAVPVLRGRSVNGGGWGASMSNNINSGGI